MLFCRCKYKSGGNSGGNADVNVGDFTGGKKRFDGNANTYILLDSNLLTENSPNFNTNITIVTLCCNSLNYRKISVTIRAFLIVT